MMYTYVAVDCCSLRFERLAASQCAARQAPILGQVQYQLDKDIDIAVFRLRIGEDMLTWKMIWK
jgi:hypothetical protein